MHGYLQNHGDAKQMDKQMTITQLEDTFIEDINSLRDWFLQYEYFLEISADMPHFDEAEKTDENRVPGVSRGFGLFLDLLKGKYGSEQTAKHLLFAGLYLYMYIC